jgi:flavin reductase (DIM6/NTAB) family NADH-FMN oxidoreductase RutF
MGFSPPLIGVGIGGKQKLSYVNSKRTGEFLICIVSVDFGQKAVSCEGYHTPGDKLWEKHGLHLQQSRKVRVPRIKEAKAVLECEATHFLEYEGDHVILVGKVIHAEAEGDLEEIDPLLHDCGGQFRNIGKEIRLNRNR